MKIIGLTGGTGSGKSTIADMIREMDIKVIDTDLVAREIVKPGKEALTEIISHFGPEIVLENDELNRKKLGSIVFADEEKLKLLNQITHKYITKEIHKEIEAAMQSPAAHYIVIDAAVLIESELHKICDEVWVAAADKAERIERIMKRDQLSYNEALNRVNSQMDDNEIKKYASAVIYTDKDMESVRSQVIKLIKDLD